MVLILRLSKGFTTAVLRVESRVVHLRPGEGGGFIIPYSDRRTVMGSKEAARRVAEPDLGELLIGLKERTGEAGIVPRARSLL